MNNKDQFNTSAFKQAIKDFDSFYAGDNSNLVPSSSGSYRFKYDDVKDLPEFKGVSKRQFLSDKDMQDSAMELAIDGKIPGRKGYNKVAYNLKNKYNTVLRSDEVAALAHIIGEEKLESFLANPSAENSAGISTQQLTGMLDKFNTAQGTDPSYRPAPKQITPEPVVQQQQQQVQMPQGPMMSEQDQMQQMPMQPVAPVEMPETQMQAPVSNEPIDTSPMTNVEIPQMDPANQSLQQMTGVQGANPMAEGGFTDHYMHKGDRRILARDPAAHNRLKDSGYGHRKLEEGGPIDDPTNPLGTVKTLTPQPVGPGFPEHTNIKDASLEALLPRGKYSNKQVQAQRDTIRAIRKIYGANVDQKTINNILGNVEIETGWGKLKETAWSTKNLKSKENDSQYKSIIGNWKKFTDAGGDYDALSSKDKLSVMYYGNTDHSNFAGGRGVLQLTAAGYGGNNRTEQEINEAAQQLGLDPAANSDDFYNSTLLTLQTYKNRGHDFSTFDSAQDARKSSVNPYEKYDKLPDWKKDTLLNYSNLENNSSVHPDDIATSTALSPEQKEQYATSNNSGRGIPNSVANNLCSSEDALSEFSKLNFSGQGPDVTQNLRELSMETDETTTDRLTSLTPNWFAKGGMIKRADGSYSKRGLWDNIRAAKGSGKKPTAAMLKQERKIKKMAEGGEVDPPTDPLIGPAEQGVDDKTKFGYVRPDSGEPSLRNPLSVLKKANWQSMNPITGNSSSYKNNSMLSTNPSDQMDLSSLENSPGATAFSNTYNNPKTKAMMLAQTDLTSEQYDNMVVQGMEPERVIGGNEPGSHAQYKNGTVYMGEGNEDDAAMETHERSHASQFDVIQQANIKKALGSAYKQGKDNKKGASYTSYIDQPHEQYGNFVQFREGLGLEPGTDMSPEELKMLVKKKGLDQSGFYKTYNDENLSNALRTVADTGGSNRYLNTAAKGGYMNFKQFQMALGGSVNDLVTRGGKNDLIEFEGGGTHEQNPLGGIPIGMNNQGQMNSVEAGESKYSFKDGDYVFSDRIKL